MKPEIALLQADAEAAFARGNHSAAHIALSKALDLLGPGYFDPSLIDDTGLHVRLSQRLFKQGRVPEAAALLQRALTERLKLVEAKPQ
jgi:hypothetical protein